jgi:predicted RNase H-like nuclease (RuvC/YqgF family)
MDENAMQVFLRSDVMSKSAQEALKHVVGLRNGLTRLERDIKDRENEIRTIDQEQSRLRKNMEAVPRESDIFARYMQKLSDQETRIEELRQELSGLQGREKFTRETLEAFIAGLDLK